MFLLKLWNTLHNIFEDLLLGCWWTDVRGQIEFDSSAAI